MIKFYRAKQVGKNKWVRKTQWKLDASDKMGLLIAFCVFGFVLVRVLLG